MNCLPSLQNIKAISFAAGNLTGTTLRKGVLVAKVECLKNPMRVRVLARTIQHIKSASPKPSIFFRQKRIHNRAAIVEGMSLTEAAVSNLRIDSVTIRERRPARFINSMVIGMATVPRQ